MASNCILRLGLLSLVLTAHHLHHASYAASGVVDDTNHMAQVMRMETRPHHSPSAPHRNLPRNFMGTSTMGTRRQTVSDSRPSEKETGN
nr:hypothetical protein Iba_chr01aCG18180 [Ipomoea batatas]GMC50490.1 hypothetical protein Iba_chr01bCG17350 [Ipomoea batatas]